MKITVLNKPTNSTITDLFTEIAEKHFSELNCEVGIFELKSTVKANSGKIALTIKNSDLTQSIKSFPFLAELEDLKLTQQYIVPFDKNIYSSKIDNVIVHELRHVEQFEMFPLDVYRSEIMRGIIDNDRSPTEKDASAFEDFFESYSKSSKRPNHSLWIKAVNNFFDTYDDEIKRYHADLIKQRNGVKVKGFIKIAKTQAWNTIITDDNLLDYALYIFNQANFN